MQSKDPIRLTMNEPSARTNRITKQIVSLKYQTLSKLTMCSK